MKKLAFAAFTVLCCAPALAQVQAQSAWARATMGGQKTSAAYLQITSDTGGVLIGAESASAETVEVHEMRMEGNVMRMRAAPRLELPAGRTVELKPGGYHIMLIGLKQPLKKGDAVPLRLKIENRDKTLTSVEVKAEVREAMAGGH